VWTVVFRAVIPCSLVDGYEYFRDIWKSEVIKGKDKGVPYRAHMAHWGKGGIATLFLNLGTGRG
jgi:hypothetical protein